MSGSDLDRETAEALARAAKTDPELGRILAGGAKVTRGRSGEWPPLSAPLTAEQREERRRAYVLSRWRAQVPASHHWAELGSPDLATRVRAFDAGRPLAARDLIGDVLRHKGNVLLLGTPGTGKTTTAACALRELYLSGALQAPGYDDDRHHWVAARDLAEAREGHPLGRGDHPLIAGAKTVSLLVIDDLGSESGTAIALAAMVSVIQERHEANRPTWVTTGLDAAAIGQRYGGGIQRRLIENAKIVQFARVAAVAPAKRGAA